MAMNRVCKILGITKPVVQAPLLMITSPKLCAAVSNAGGLGCLGINIYGKPEATLAGMRKSIQETKKLTDKPFAINAFPKAGDHFGLKDGLINICKEEGVKVIVFVGETSEKEIKELKQQGFTVIARELTPTIKGAQKAERAGADIIVATGCDEGGIMPSNHTGTISQVALLSDAVKVPILAAGAIINEKMAKASAIVGAEGAFVGTRFILSEENPVPPMAKKDILNTPADDYIVAPFMNGFARHKKSPEKAKNNGFGNNTLAVCNLAPLIKSIEPCKKIVEEIARGYL